MESEIVAIAAPNIRSVLQEANRRGIEKNQIVNLLKEGEQYVLVYYKDIVDEY